MAPGFFVLAIVSGTMQFIAPDRPEKLFIGVILALLIATLGLLFLSKKTEPKPVNWITVDVMFTSAFSVIHFAYFFYWWVGALGGRQEIWYIRAANVPHTVCSGLCMYLTCVNLFLFGFHIVKTTRSQPLINDAQSSKPLIGRWGKLGRFLIRLGFCGFLGYVIIVGPAVVFGAYSGTNNKGFLPNICFQLGQVFLSAGVTILVVSRFGQMPFLYL